MQQFKNKRLRYRIDQIAKKSTYMLIVANATQINIDRTILIRAQISTVLFSGELAQHY